jgi:hypothetical protein
MSVGAGAVSAAWRTPAHTASWRDRWLNWRRGHTRGLQPSMMLLWAAAGLPLGIHNILAELNGTLAQPVRSGPQVLNPSAISRAAGAGPDPHGALARCVRIESCTRPGSDMDAQSHGHRSCISDMCVAMSCACSAAAAHAAWPETEVEHAQDAQRHWRAHGARRRHRGGFCLWLSSEHSPCASTRAATEAPLAQYGAQSVPSSFILAMAILAAVGLGLGVGRCV